MMDHPTSHFVDAPPSKTSPFTPMDIIFNIPCSFYSQNNLQKIWVQYCESYQKGLTSLSRNIKFQSYSPSSYEKITFQFIIIFLFEWVWMGDRCLQKCTQTQMRLLTSTSSTIKNWYVSNVSIIFDAPCLFLHHLPWVSLHFVAFLCNFQN
jgi:hypothetical protein